jgi:phenylacetic acid degradation operon negative regulatory protein
MQVMNESTKKNQSFSKKILALLASKPAVSVADLTEGVNALGSQKYALTRSLKGLQDSGLIETHHSGQQVYTRLTQDGKRKVHSLKLEQDSVLFDPTWDGKWRIILLDLPEDRKAEREGLRYLLKKAGFILLKNSVWISPHPFEHLFMNIKKDLNLTTEIMIFVTDTLDSETEKAFEELVK